MTPEDKILLVLKQLANLDKLSAADSPCYLDPHSADFKNLPQIELKTILEKLESDKTLEILKTPFEVWPDLGRENEPDVYTIKILEGFDAYYDSIYEVSRFGINNLSYQNYYRVYGVAQEINQELNIIKGNNVRIAADKTTSTLWKGINQKSVSLHDIKQIKLKSLSFLKDVGAIDAYQLDDNDRVNPVFNITASRRKFDTVFLELIVKSTANKRTSLVNKSVPNKRPNPKVEKSDNTPPVADKELIEETALTTNSAEIVSVHPLQPSHYHDKTGKLAVSGTVDVSIAVRGKVARKNRIKYDQCHLMSCLFKSVNTLKYGVTFSTFLGVKYDKNNKKHIRKIRNTVDEINKKVAGKTTAKRLIFIQAEKIFLNSSYL